MATVCCETSLQRSKCIGLGLLIAVILIALIANWAEKARVAYPAE